MARLHTTGEAVVLTEADLTMTVEELEAFEGSELGRKYPTASRTFRDAWERFTPFLAFPAALRRVIYTTNAIESLNFQLRKIIKSRGAFPTDEAATKLLFLALRNAQKTWGRPFAQFRQALAQFAIYFGDRISL